MIFRLALLLIGPNRLAISSVPMFFFGVFLMGLGGGIIFDASDHHSILVEDILGGILVFLGIMEGLYALYTADANAVKRGMRAFMFILLGSIVVFDPATVDYWDPLILAAVFMFLGAFKIVFSVVGRYSRWKFVLADGILHFLLGALLFNDWRHHSHWMVPLLFGVGLMLLGSSALSSAWLLRKSRLLLSRTSDAVCAVQYYIDHHVGARYRCVFERLPSLLDCHESSSCETDQTGDTTGELKLYIWLTKESADHEVRASIPLFSDYVVAHDCEGEISIGHSALECAPDVYISHYNLEEYEKMASGARDISVGEEGMFRRARARDEEGAFVPTHAEEVHLWMPPNRIIRLSPFNPDYLRAFWQYYRQDATYNLAQRNCSVSVILAVDMALLGCLRGPHTFSRFLRLLCHYDLWVAAFIRRRAEDMVWSPQLVFDYVTALQRVIKKEERFSKVAKT